MHILYTHTDKIKKQQLCDQESPYKYITTMVLEVKRHFHYLRTPQQCLAEYKYIYIYIYICIFLKDLLRMMSFF